MPRIAHPPNPGTLTLPSFASVESAFDEVDFPVTKRELMREVDGATVLFRGENRDLRELVRDLYDDAFDSADELLEALYGEYGAEDGGTEADAPAPPPVPD